jgi:hypothetical protein
MYTTYSQAMATPKPAVKKLQTQQRAIKMKTEMCQTILNGYLCKYGSACTFAHSVSELATMGDRQERGKLDLSTFKRCQCFTQLATGAW